MSSPSEPAVVGGRWDWRAIREGAWVAAVLAVPFTLVARFFFDSDAHSGWAAILALGSFLGFVLGAGQAAWRQDRGTPLSHGLVTAVGTYVVVQAVFVVIRLIAGRDVNWFGVFFTLGLVLLAGVVGGLLGARLQASGFTPSTRSERP